MARTLYRHEFEDAPRHEPCPHYGGACLGDGCVKWFPLPSGTRFQEAACAIERSHEPIHRAEARRKAIRYLMWAADAPDPVNQLQHLARANNWMFASYSAPLRPTG